MSGTNLNVATCVNERYFRSAILVFLAHTWLFLRIHGTEFSPPT